MHSDVPLENENASKRRPVTLKAKSAKNFYLIFDLEE